MTASVDIVEVGPRDGLQNEQRSVSTVDKVQLVRRAVAAGTRRVEVTAFVHPTKVPQMADAEKVLAALPRSPLVRLAVLVLNERGLERALRCQVDEVNVVVVATDTFSMRNQGRTREDMLQVWERIAQRARSEGLFLTGTVAAAFGCPYEGEVPPELVSELVDRMAQSHPDELALADTIGVGVPAQVRELADRLAAAAPHIQRRFHFHNTRNTGYANALAAVTAGVDVLDASTGGIGGCPFAPNATGNLATEDLQYLLERSGYRTGLDAEALAATAEWTGDLLGVQVPGLLHRAGRFPGAVR